MGGTIVSGAARRALADYQFDGQHRFDVVHRFALQQSQQDPYNTAKTAAFTQDLTRNCAPDKIRVNAVCPGEIHTPMLEAGVTRSGRTIANLNKIVAFGRVGKPEEVAALVAFPASEVSAFMCGSLVEITDAQAVA
ncbi:NAD(P)-dependent dehydrogenase (short-subunit alcohol dehydrogenase family) [Pararhizobium capsulatum DSM 1112]|uniref:NAD(P)-dependent dehydrogenase (Short-subunit alcohol dehydrogenase family) n=1 Tax=Pararhizobium capsulatum DSM 1112 TaxID=1121113 RepID=A0ABU0BZF3_9HYPH|nr:NAD(P)-dependent dehydrogenase (short-subunit alcohol dehydrogenase family) [Pararhizobium capsulatum DSM 1112]